MTIRTVAESWTARMLSVLRIATGVVLLQHPIQKFFQFPVPRPGPQALSLVWFAGAIELGHRPINGFSNLENSDSTSRNGGCDGAL